MSGTSEAQKPVQFHLTWRDAYQSNQGTRVPADLMVESVRHAADYGADSFQIGGGTFFAQFCANGRNPYKEIELIGDHFKHAPGSTTALYRSACGMSTNLQSLDTHRDVLTLLGKNGVQKILNFHGMNDAKMTAFVPSLLREINQRHGLQMEAVGTVCVQTNDLENPERGEALALKVQKDCEFAEELVRQGHTGIYIKNANGVLDPVYTGALVQALRSRLGPEIEIGLHVHDTYGLAASNYIEAIKAGVSSVDVLPAALSGGTAQISLENLIYFMREMNDSAVVSRIPEINLPAIKEDEYSAYFVRGLYSDGEMPYDPQALELAKKAGAAGGAIGVLKKMEMITLVYKALGTEDWGTVRDELYRVKAQIREKLGYPTNVTPYEMMLDVQAAQSLIGMSKGRNALEILHPMTLDYLTGKWGRVSDRVDPDLQARALVARGLDAPLAAPDVAVLPSTKDAARAEMAEAGSRRFREHELLTAAVAGGFGKKYVLGVRDMTVRASEVPELKFPLQEGGRMAPVVPLMFAAVYKAQEAYKLRNGFFVGVQGADRRAEQIEAEIEDILEEIPVVLKQNGLSKRPLGRTLSEINFYMSGMARKLGVDEDFDPAIKGVVPIMHVSKLIGDVSIYDIQFFLEQEARDFRDGLGEVFGWTANSPHQQAIARHMRQIAARHQQQADHSSDGMSYPALDADQV
ncbi:MAG: hypothetical protein KDI13_07535 [Alphaproteobacteria bacterium]|nr:hypothetical protein [Alphaproteobacteria bacterium]